MMCHLSSMVHKMGHTPYIPGLDLLLGVIAGDWNEEDYRKTSLEFLEVCDAVLVISDSQGVRQEVAKAKELFIPIYYSWAMLPEVLDH